MDRARSAAEQADVVVAVLDAAAGVTGDDARFLARLAGRAVVVAVNKADTADTAPARAEARAILGDDTPVVATAAPAGDGVEALSDAIADAATGGGPAEIEAALVTSARHEAALREASAALTRARDTLARGLPPELIAVDAHGALHALGAITGETAREEIIAGIFARFCIGK